jgi:glycosyltransferase involved in cell wall biosynthesis
MRILLLTDWYEPGYRAGGPIRSCVHLAQLLSQEHECLVLTTNRDLGAPMPYPDIEPDTWIELRPGLRVYYASPERLSLHKLRKLILEARPDCLYLNSMYSRMFTLGPLAWHRVGLLPVPVVLAPRGMLRAGALQFKATKKIGFLRLAGALGLYRDVHFHATDEQERRDVQRWFPKNPVQVLPNVPELPAEQATPVQKQRGTLRLVFVGRISPVKNLDFLIDQLPGLQGNIHLDIIGPLEDEAYWNICLQKLQGFSWQYLGEQPHVQIRYVLQSSHVFALPTLGENFGHAIWEALAMGRPVLISDQTPWQNLEAVKAGWVCSLQKPETFRQALRQAIELDQSEFDSWSQSTLQYAQTYFQQQDLAAEYSQLFRGVV